MKKTIKILGSAVRRILPSNVYSFVKKWYFYTYFIAEYLQFKKYFHERESRFPLEWKDRNPQLLDRTEKTGFDAHYIYHPAWAARILIETKPVIHTDISSTLAFSSIVSAYVPVRFYDYRPANLYLPNLSAGRADLLHLPFNDESINSLSCMHVVEHIGLGRYGDPISPDADLTAINELKRVLAPKGNLLFVVPVGKPKIIFNAHRIYSYAQIMQYFSELHLSQFTLIPDDADTRGMLTDATEEDADAQKYGCGCFWFTKK